MAKVLQSHSIDLALIEQRSRQADYNQTFYRNFDQSRNRFSRSKISKNQFFFKKEHFMQKLLKAQCFINRMHEYEMNFFFQKHLNSTQIFQKQEFQSICPKISNFKHILHHNQGTLILDGHNMITHNIMY